MLQMKKKSWLVIGEHRKINGHLIVWINACAYMYWHESMGAQVLVKRMSLSKPQPILMISNTFRVLCVTQIFVKW